MTYPYYLRANDSVGWNAIVKNFVSCFSDNSAPFPTEISHFLENIDDVHRNLFSPAFERLWQKYTNNFELEDVIALVEISTSINNNIRMRNRVDVVYMDFSRAFDRIDHRLQLNKLARYSMPLQLFRVIASFICNRSYELKIGRDTSASQNTFAI